MLRVLGKGLRVFYSVIISVAGVGDHDRWFRPWRYDRIEAASEREAARKAVALYPGQDARIQRVTLSARQTEGRAV